MKNKSLILSILLLLPLSIMANDLIKTGVYNFDDVIENMGKEPQLRALMPDVLKENLFLIKMIRVELNTHNARGLRSGSVEDQIEYHVKAQYLSKIMNDTLERSESDRKSNKMKNYLFSGIYAAQNYFGYNLILKPSSFILFSDKTLLNPSIANALALYLENQEKAKQQYENVDETQE